MENFTFSVLISPLAYSGPPEEPFSWISARHHPGSKGTEGGHGIQCNGNLAVFLYNAFSLTMKIFYFVVFSFSTDDIEMVVNETLLYLLL